MICKSCPIVYEFTTVCNGTDLICRTMEGLLAVSETFYGVGNCFVCPVDATCNGIDI